MSDLSTALLGTPSLAPVQQPSPSPFAQLLLRLLGRHGPANSSPSVFDAKTAIGEHNQRLQQALDSSR